MRTFQTLFLFLVFTHLSIAQDKVEMLDSLFNTMHERGQYSGNVVVVNNGELIYQKSIGYTDRSSEAILNENTLFNIGSVSKIFTAVAILQLWEKGLLDIDEVVVKYLPGFPYKRITVGHLLTHASGLPAKSDLQNAMAGISMPGNDEFINFLIDQEQDLQFDPGQNSLFNDVGYIILAKIVEELSKKEFTQYVKEEIFAPAEMNRTGIYNAVEIKEVPNSAKGYLFSPFTMQYEEAINSPDFPDQTINSGTVGDANVWSTTGDLFSFCKAISSAVLLSDEMVGEMFLKKTDAKMPGQTRSYGNSFSYGWIIPDAPFRIAQARGDIPGFNASIIWNLTEKRMIIYLSNDYLSFTSYNNLLAFSVGTIVNQNVLNIPRKYASVEMTNEVLHISEADISNKMNTLKNDTIKYDFDVAGLRYLMDRLKDLGEVQKAELIESMLYE